MIRSIYLPHIDASLSSKSNLLVLSIRAIALILTFSFIAFSVGSCATPSVTESLPSTSSGRADPVVTTLQQYYENASLSSEWQLVNIEADQINRISATFTVSNALASLLQTVDRDQQEAIAQFACPLPDAEVWAQLQGRQGIEIVLVNQNNIVAYADCPK